MSKVENLHEEISELERPSKPGDEVVAKLRKKYSLPEDASLAQIEPVAKILLANLTNSLDGAQLVLNRRVDAKEKLILQLIKQGETDEKFSRLLIEKATEEMMREKGLTDFDTKEGFK